MLRSAQAMEFGPAHIYRRAVCLKASHRRRASARTATSRAALPEERVLSVKGVPVFAVCLALVVHGRPTSGRIPSQPSANAELLAPFLGERTAEDGLLRMGSVPLDGSFDSACLARPLPARVYGRVLGVVNMTARAMGLRPIAVSPLREHVCGVIGYGPEKEMCGIGAGRIVASVQHAEAVRDRPVVNLPRNAMGFSHLTADGELPIAPAVEARSPFPTSISFSDLRQESIRERRRLHACFTAKITPVNPQKRAR